MSMDTDRTPKPGWAGEYGPTYEEIVKSWGYDVEAFETFGSYQGDHLALLGNGGAVGLIVFGYGSCSGCDELEAISPATYGNDDDESDWQPVVDFAKKLRDEVHWEGDRNQLRDWVMSQPENHWWSYDDEIAGWLNANLGTSLRADA